LAVWTFILTGSVAIGLTLGGVITDTLSWRWIFVINIPVVVLLLADTPRLVPARPGLPGTASTSPALS
jgi:MFS family permease